MLPSETTREGKSEDQAKARELDTLKTFVARAVLRLTLEDPRFSHIFTQAVIAELTSALEHPSEANETIALDTKLEVLRDPRTLSRLVDALQMHCWEFIDSEADFEVHDAIAPVIRDHVE